MRAPIWRFGGKGQMVAKLLPLFPVHHTYVEPFAGAGSMLFAKKPAPVEVFNDLDGGLVNLYRVLRDPEQFERFRRMAELTPYSREEYLTCRETWENEPDAIVRAWQWWVVARMAFSGCFGESWGMVTTHSRRGMAGTCSKLLSAIASLPQIHERLQVVQIECSDFRRIFEIYDTTETFFYCDPPYIASTRRGGGYVCEMTDDDHRDLVQILLGLKGKAMLSGYDHPIYSELTESGWRKGQFEVACSAAGRTKASGLQGKGSATEKQPRTETIWMNYPAADPDWTEMMTETPAVTVEGR